jgi:NAD(P)-dependent dehydrogenase (short-subunit alcohol dehydrogenase family)
LAQKLLSEQSEMSFKPDASYLVVGGLGGLGRAICRWMTRKGARYLILPSRSGAQTEVASEAMRELREAGVTVEAPVCDAASLEDLSAMLHTFQGTMPPIKGCINAAMVLEVFFIYRLSRPRVTVDINAGIGFRQHDIQTVEPSHQVQGQHVVELA